MVSTTRRSARAVKEAAARDPCKRGTSSSSDAREQQREYFVLDTTTRYHVPIPAAPGLALDDGFFDQRGFDAVVLDGEEFCVPKEWSTMSTSAIEAQFSEQCDAVARVVKRALHTKGARDVVRADGATPVPEDRSELLRAHARRMRALWANVFEAISADHAAFSARGGVCMHDELFALLRSACFVQFLAHGGFNTVYAHRWSDVVVRVSRVSRGAASVDAFRRDDALIRALQSPPDAPLAASCPTAPLLPRLYARGVVSAQHVTVEVWRRCAGSCGVWLHPSSRLPSQLCCGPLHLAEEVIFLVEGVAARGFLNCDLKWSNFAYALDGDAFACFLIDVDHRYFVDYDEYAAHVRDRQSAPPTAIMVSKLFAATMVAMLAAQARETALGGELRALIAPELANVPEEFKQFLEGTRLRHTYKYYALRGRRQHARVRRPHDIFLLASTGTNALLTSTSSPSTLTTSTL